MIAMMGTLDKPNGLIGSPTRLSRPPAGKMKKSLRSNLKAFGRNTKQRLLTQLLSEKMRVDAKVHYDTYVHTSVKQQTEKKILRSTTH